jgi:hypothetical protein
VPARNGHRHMLRARLKRPVPTADHPDLVISASGVRIVWDRSRVSPNDERKLPRQQKRHLLAFREAL